MTLSSYMPLQTSADACNSTICSEARSNLINESRLQELIKLKLAQSSIVKATTIATSNLMDSFKGNKPKWFLNPKLPDIDNPQFRKLLNGILSEISYQLTKYDKNEEATIDVTITADKEIPDWEEFKIIIRLQAINNDEDFFYLKNRIRKKVRDRISNLGISDEKVLNKYGDPLIVLKEF